MRNYLIAFYFLIFYGWLAFASGRDQQVSENDFNDPSEVIFYPQVHYAAESSTTTIDVEKVLKDNNDVLESQFRIYHSILRQVKSLQELGKLNDGEKLAVFSEVAFFERDAISGDHLLDENFFGEKTQEKLNDVFDDDVPDSYEKLDDNQKAYFIRFGAVPILYAKHNDVIEVIPTEDLGFYHQVSYLDKLPKSDLSEEITLYVRELLVIRQILENKKKWPILVYGRAHDYGTFNEVLENFGIKFKIRFGFDLSSSCQRIGRHYNGNQKDLLNLSREEYELIKFFRTLWLDMIDISQSRSSQEDKVNSVLLEYDKAPWIKKSHRDFSLKQGKIGTVPDSEILDIKPVKKPSRSKDFIVKGLLGASVIAGGTYFLNSYLSSSDDPEKSPKKKIKPKNYSETDELLATFKSMTNPKETLNKILEDGFKGPNDRSKARYALLLMLEMCQSLSGEDKEIILKKWAVQVEKNGLKALIEKILSKVESKNWNFS